VPYAAPEPIVIEDQGPRDGFQVEKAVVPTDLKLELIQGLVDAGVRRVQVCSFVSPRAVPQMADAEALCARLPRRDGVVFSGLVLNEKGIDRAIQAGLRHVACSYSASDTHSRKNTRMSLEEAQSEVERTVKKAKAAGLTVRGGLQCVFGCRYEGRVAPEAVLRMVERHLELGVDEIALADSTGMADPRAVRWMVDRVLPMAEGRPVLLHLHDTEGRAMANALAAIERGVRHFDAAFAGMGGCPYIPGASGNLSTEDLAAAVHAMGYETGIDVRKVAALSLRVEAFFGKPFWGKMHRVLATEGIRTFA
jgi:hydroxymethylglutaryl-CoA lyase